MGCLPKHWDPGALVQQELQYAMLEQLAGGISCCEEGGRGGWAARGGEGGGSIIVGFAAEQRRQARASSSRPHGGLFSGPIMTKEENLEVQEKERHDHEEQEEGRAQKEEEEEALTEEEEEEEEEEEREEQERAEVDEDEGDEQEEEREEEEEEPPAEQEPEPPSVTEFQSPVHEPRRRAMVHPSAQAPLPKDYAFTFFDPNDPACLEILMDPQTTIPELFAIVRQWVPQVQHKIDIIGKEESTAPEPASRPQTQQQT
ncbi:hypothetical protein OJAV_G00134310 [Oryzias javanicus]|uniref:Uncharacterized protein n=1 Tax=Oryzias javanicus TaxID=123683 RepID=A0A437CR98_ORYJA|nr:hypothetical protein OJAV_G00134310 [Oryzias javanicus]